MITKDRLSVGVAVVVGAVVGFFAGQERPLLGSAAAEDVMAAAELGVFALVDLLWRLFLVVLVIDIGLTLTYRWSAGMTRPMLCLFSTEIFYHYTRAMYVIVDATLGYWFPEHQKQEAF